MTKTVLVTGATGRQGGAVARALLKVGHHVRALVRNRESEGARVLAKAGAILVDGNLDEPVTVREAATGADAMFLMGNYYEVGGDGEARQGIGAADAARDAGVPHLIYSSVASANRGTGIPHFESKYRVEQHISRTAVDYTIVAPAAFMENTVAPWALDALRAGSIAAPLPASRKNQLVAAEDIGAFVAALVERGPSVFGRRYDIAGDSLSGNEQAEILSRAIGRKVSYAEIPLDVARQQSADTAAMFEWIDRVGYDVDIPALQREFPEVAWTSFEQWASRQDWGLVRPAREAISA